MSIQLDNFTKETSLDERYYWLTRQALWICPDTELQKKTISIALLVGGKDNTGMGVWSWSYASQMPNDLILPATLTLPYRNTGDLNEAGKYVVAATWIIKNTLNTINKSISLVGHSLGNMAIAWALHYRPTFIGKTIRSYIALSADFKGSSQALPANTAQPYQWQTTKHSEFMKNINSTPFPNVFCLSIISNTDETLKGRDPHYVSKFPDGTLRTKVVTIQSAMKHNRYISHVDTLADSGAYELVRSTLRSMIVDHTATKVNHYPFLERSGLESTSQSGNNLSHRGDAPLVDAEPSSTDQIV